jgi:integrase
MLISRSTIFLQGHYNTLLPVVTQMSGAGLINIITTTPTAKPPGWAADALVKSTRDTHRRMLQWLCGMPKQFQELPVATAVSEYMKALRGERGWTWATTLKNMASAQGALALLPMYRVVEHGVLLKHDVTWAENMRAVTRFAREEEPRTPKAMTTEIFTATMATERDLQRRVVLALMWYTAQRVGCVLQLSKDNMHWNPNDTLSVTLKRGKSVKLRGPYTVHTTSLKTLKPMLMQYLNDVKPGARLFTLTPADMLSTFRLVDATMEARSIRRGTLQAMAQAGVPNDTLREYSGHTNDRTLLRYLNWGKAAGNARTRMETAGRVLSG